MCNADLHKPQKLNSVGSAVCATKKPEKGALRTRNRNCLHIGTMTYANISLTSAAASFWKFNGGNIDEWWVTCSEKSYLTGNGGDAGGGPGVWLTLSPRIFSLIVLQYLSMCIPISKEV